MSNIANQPLKKKIVSSSIGKQQVAKKTLKKHQHFIWRRIFKWIAIPVLTVGLAVFIFGLLLFVFYASSTPKLDIAKLQSQPNTTILDNKGNVVASLGAEQRINVSTDKIPMKMVNAVTSIEDHTFFSNRGVDPVRIVGSVIHNAQSDTIQGGSTISQELIKLSYFSTAESDQTLKRKAQEAWLSLEMNKKLSKEEILTLYINKVYMSNGYYGMQTASKNFYQKSLSQLDLAQTALLAGIPQAPNKYDPYKNPKLAKYRRDLVLQAMYKYGKITKKQENQAINTPIDEGLKTLPVGKSIPAYLNNYITEVINQVKSHTGKDPMTTGMKIYTPLDNKAQHHLDAVTNTDQYITYPDSDFQAATTIIDVHTGGVVAQLGGRHQPTDSVLGTNQAVNTNRDFGSTMKPITDYGPAIDYGIYKSTAQVIADTPYDFPGTSDSVTDWDNMYYGNITMRYALWQSRNIPAVKTLAAVGLQDSTAFLKKLGIQYPQETYSNAISSNTSETGNKWGASSEKMAAAYAAFANGGTYYKPYYVNKIVYSDGSTVNFKHSHHEAMKATTAYMITDMLKGVITSGTQPFSMNGVIAAGKTGTSNYTPEELTKVPGGIGAPDESFIGFNTNYSIAIWTGYTNRLTPVWGTDTIIASQIFKALMTYMVSQDGSNKDWTMPKGLTRSGSELFISSNSSSNNSNYYGGVYSSSIPSSSSTYTSSSTTTSSSSNSIVPPSSSAPSTGSEPPESSSSTATNNVPLIPAPAQ